MGLYQRYVFPWLLDFVMSQEPFRQRREQLLGAAAGEVLEIGFGTGLNLPHYPREVKALTAVDPCDGLRRRVAARIAAAPMPVARLALDAQRIPLESGRFDCIVTTWTLCTIPEVQSALGEIHRLLKPGGSYLFVEHGRSDDPAVARWQDRLNPVQRLLAGGCNLNRPIDALIDEAGLRIEALDRFVLQGSPRVLGSSFIGRAVRT